MLSFLSASTGIAGALLIALNINFFIGYILFLISNIGWLIIANQYKNTSMSTMNYIYAIINIIGLANYYKG